MVGGMLKIKSLPSGADIFITIDGKRLSLGKTPFSGGFNYGTYKIELLKDGYETQVFSNYNLASSSQTITAILQQTSKSLSKKEVSKQTETETDNVINLNAPVRTIKVVQDEMVQAFKDGRIVDGLKLFFEFINAPIDESVATANFGSPPVALPGGSWTSILKNWKTIAKVITTIAGTTTFISFLYEEALQTAGMGVWVQVSNKNWSQAQIQLNRARNLLDKANFMYNYFGWLNPFTWRVFKTYADATQSQYDSYQAAIDKNLGTFIAPNSTGKVFDNSTFQSNLSSGVSPSVTSLVAEEVPQLPEPTEVPTTTPTEEIEPSTTKSGAVKFTTPTGRVVYLGQQEYGLMIDSTPDGAEVRINGRKRKFEADAVYTTTANNVNVDVSLDGFNTLSFVADLRLHDIITYQVDLENQKVVKLN